jgi:hypothetical protein
MREVGMYKQAKYDEGVQKIQTAIDNVAGLDIAKDVHKGYLQSKLNELGNNLKTVAAGDFYIFQLVNSTAGMANAIAKDEIIQNAVTSTARIKKQQGILEKAKLEGKSSVQNEAFFNRDVNKFLSDNDLKSSYTGQYINYIDIDKKLRDVADKIKEVDNSVEIPYKRDNAGNVLYYDAKGNASNDPSKGTVKIDDAILSIKTKGKPAQKILDNFYSSLNENDLQQLHIDGWYHYKNSDVNVVKSDLKTSYEDSKKLYNDQIVELNLELQSNPKLTDAEKSKKQAELNDINTKLTKVEKDYSTMLTSLDTEKGFDEYKYKIYTQKTLQNLAKDMSNMSYQQEYKSNPYAQMDMEKKKLQFDYDNANRQQRNWERDFAFDQKKFEITTNLERAKLQIQADGKKGSAPVVTPGALPTNVDTPTLGKLNTTISGIKNDIAKLNSDYAPLLTANIKDPKNKKKYLDALASKYYQDPGSITSMKDPNIREYLERRRVLDIDLGQKNNLYASAVKESSRLFDPEMDKVFSKVGGLSLPNGKQLFSAKELWTVNNSFGKYFKQVQAGASGPTGAIRYKNVFNSEGFLNEYKGTKYEGVAQSLVADYNRSSNMSPTAKLIAKKAKQIGATMSSSVGDIAAKKYNYQTEYLAKRMPERQTQIGTLDKSNKVDVANINGLIGTKLEQYKKYGALDSTRKEDFDPETLGKVLKDSKASYLIEKKFDGSANLIVTNGVTRQVVPMTASEMGSFFPNYAKRNPVEGIKYAVMSSPNHTTNLKGGGNDASAAVNAYLSGYDVPNLASTKLAQMVRMDVEGSPFNDGSNNDRYSVRMYVNDNGHWKTDIITQEGYVTEAGIISILNNVGPKTISDFLKKNK